MVEYFTSATKRLRLLSGILVVLGIAALGTYLLVGSHAAAPYTSITADNGSLADGSTEAQGCVGASDSNCVVFTQASPMDGKVSLALNQSGTPFAASSFWNTPLPANTPTNPNSPTYVSNIVSQLGSNNGNVTTARWSVPFYVVPANQPCVPIILNASSTNHSSAIPTLQTQLSQGTGNCHGVPIPADAVPAGGTDAHLAVYQPSSDTLWEFWRLSTPADNAPGATQLPWSVGETAVPSYGDNQWHTVWGGVMNSVSTSNGIFPNPYAGWTTGLPLLGSVARIEELQAGQINHAIGFSLNNNLIGSAIPANTLGASNGISWPADRSDGTSTDPLAVPEGLRFRLPANLDLSQYDLSPVAKVIAVTAQKYGLVLDATGSPVSLLLGDPTPYTVAGLPNPYSTGPGVGGIGNKGLFNGAAQSSIMANFPWNQLQALPFNYGEPSQ